MLNSYGAVRGLHYTGKNLLGALVEFHSTTENPFQLFLVKLVTCHYAKPSFEVYIYKNSDRNTTHKPSSYELSLQQLGYGRL